MSEKRKQEESPQGTVEKYTARSKGSDCIGEREELEKKLRPIEDFTKAARVDIRKAVRRAIIEDILRYIRCGVLAMMICVPLVCLLHYVVCKLLPG